MLMARWWLLAGLVCESTAHADPVAGASAIRLDYTAPPECPTRDALIARVRERATVNLDDNATRTLAIAVTSDAVGFRATLAIDGGGRELTAASCDDVVSAAALVAAIALGPHDPPDPGPPPAPDPPPPPPPTPPIRVDPPPPIAIATPRSWRFEPTIGIGLGVGITPDPLATVRVGAAIAVRSWTAGIDVIGGRDSTQLMESEASFTWLVARPSGCRRVFARRLEVSACAHLELGATWARGKQIVNGRQIARGWVAPGAHGVARWGLADRSFAEFQLGLSVPAIRDRYRFMPDLVIHETSIVTGWALLGGGLLF